MEVGSRYITLFFFVQKPKFTSNEMKKCTEEKTSTLRARSFGNILE